MEKATYGQVCTTCDDTVGLSCNTGNYCVCNTSANYFWNGTYCSKCLNLIWVNEIKFKTIY